MSAGADVTAVSEEGSTPLHYLALSQSDEAANIATKIIGTKNPNLDEEGQLMEDTDEVTRLYLAGRLC